MSCVDLWRAKLERFMLLMSQQQNIAVLLEVGGHPTRVGILHEMQGMFPNMSTLYCNTTRSSLLLVDHAHDYCLARSIHAAREPCRAFSSGALRIKRALGESEAAETFTGTLDSNCDYVAPIVM